MFWLAPDILNVLVDRDALPCTVSAESSVSVFGRFVDRPVSSEADVFEDE